MANENKYVLEMVRNENREDVQVQWNVFRGRWAFLPLGSGALFLPISCFCMVYGLDIWMLLILGSTPFILSSLFVIIFVNGRYPSYPIDMAKWWMFQLLEKLFMAGWLDREPRLWSKR